MTMLYREPRPPGTKNDVSRSGSIFAMYGCAIARLFLHPDKSKRHLPFRIVSASEYSTVWPDFVPNPAAADSWSLFVAAIACALLATNVNNSCSRIWATKNRYGNLEKAFVRHKETLRMAEAACDPELRIYMRKLLYVLSVTCVVVASPFDFFCLYYCNTVGGVNRCDCISSVGTLCDWPAATMYTL